MGLREAGVIQSALAEFIWERVEIIGSGTVQPTVGKAFRGVKWDTLLTLESRRGRRSAWGLKAIPGEQGTPFLPPPDLRTQSKECCTRIVPFTPDNKSKPVFLGV